MSTTADDLLKEAIAGTEAEIFNEATGKDGPSTEGGPGDRSVEDMGTGHEGQLEADEPDLLDTKAEGEGAEGEGGEGDTKAYADDQTRDPKTGLFVAKPAETKTAAEAPTDPKARVPLSDLITERKARQALQKQLDDERTSASSQFQQLNARIDQLMAGGPRQQAQPAVENAPEKPDIFSDPDAFVANLTKGIEEGFTKKFVAADLQRTYDQHGEEFNKAFTAITTAANTDPNVAAEIRRIYQSPMPGSGILKWAKDREAQQLVGSDPAAFIARVNAEAEAKLLENPAFLEKIAAKLGGTVAQAAPATPGATPRPVFRMPKSLNSAAGGGANTPVPQSDGSERGVFEDAFKD